MKLNSEISLFVLFSSFILTRSKKVNYVEDNDLVVELANPVGKIQGYTLQSENGADFYAFQDVPYAKPPIGENRFKPPKPMDPWEGILNTTSNQKICPQSSTGDTSSDQYFGEEDCLVLNVYTPVKPGSNASLPVFFWIHGGAFVSGTGGVMMQNPKFLIDYDIVIVTINYRLGALGFLTTNDENIPGNLGYRDQHLALKWTQGNIHLFGGDPQKVTMGGESAGGMAVGVQMLSPLNKNLFRGVIESSGAGIGTAIYQDKYQKWAFEFGRILNGSFNSNQSGDLVELLQKASLDDIMANQFKVSDTGTNGFMPKQNMWSPIIEGSSTQGAIVTGPMLDDFVQGNFNKVPLLIGFNSEESLTFLSRTSDEQFAEAAKNYDEDVRLMISDSLNVSEDNKKSAGLELKNVYTNSTFSEDKAAFIRYTSDEIFVRSTLRQAEAVSQHVPVYLYQLSWGAVPSEAPGVPHGTDLLYLWIEDHPEWTTVSELRKPFQKLWTNFIKELNPTPVEDEDLQSFDWLPMQPGSVQYFNINQTFEMLENPRNYYAMRNIIDKVAEPPHNVF